MIETTYSERLKIKTDFTQILRWEDDGGAICDIDIPPSQMAGTDHPRPNPLPGDDLVVPE
jgi:hypothetical protein